VEAAGAVKVTAPSAAGAAASSDGAADAERGGAREAEREADGAVEAAAVASDGDADAGFGRGRGAIRREPSREKNSPRERTPRGSWIWSRLSKLRSEEGDRGSAAARSPVAREVARHARGVFRKKRMSWLGLHA
jgi:hypothetical protein